MTLAGLTRGLLWCLPPGIPAADVPVLIDTGAGPVGVAGVELTEQGVVIVAGEDHDARH